MRHLIRGNLVTPDGVMMNGVVTVKDGVIVAIEQEQSCTPHLAQALTTHSELTTDLPLPWVMPGMIDTHSDAIETEMQPRPTSRFSIHVAFHELERKLISQGVTTVYHSLSMYAEDASEWVRKNETVQQLIEDIRNLCVSGSIIHHRIHLRFEITNLSAVSYVEDLLKRRLIHQLSFMDHSPGQGQFRNIEIQKKLMMHRNNLSDEEATLRLEDRRAKSRVDARELTRLAALANEQGIPLASHDDDTLDKMDAMKDWNVTISEFPVELNVAIEAKRRGFFVVMGAPNVVLGRSHSDNLAALEAIQHEAVDILCSDYYPPAMIQAVFSLFRRGVPLHQAVNMVTRNPATALGLGERVGALEVGKSADIVVVDAQSMVPAIREVYVGGARVFQMARGAASSECDF